MKLILPQRLVDQVEAAARTAFPRECCGLIEGRWNGAEAHAVALHPAPDGDMDSFAIDPESHFAAVRSARANGHALIGCYHSHPNGMSRPSDVDRKGAGEENFLWVIATLDDAGAPVRLRVWRYFGADFEETGWATGADWVTSSS
jgi:proteasome lid subunit RPN8/RPN11